MKTHLPNVLICLVFMKNKPFFPPNNNKVLPDRLMCARCAQQIRLAATQSSTSSFDIQPRIYAARCKEMLHGSKDGTEYVTLILYARSISESLEEKPGWGGGEDISSTRCLTKDRREELQTKAFKTKLKWRKKKVSFLFPSLVCPCELLFHHDCSFFGIWHLLFKTPPHAQTCLWTFLSKFDTTALGHSIRSLAWWPNFNEFTTTVLGSRTFLSFSSV